MKKILFILTLIALFSASFSASFDCKKAKTNVEKLICSNETLSQLDDELNVAYKNALSAAKTDKEREYLKKRQITWLKKLQKDCEIIDQCYFVATREYVRKIFFLQPDNGFNIIYSEDNKTCNQFANLLNNDIKQYNEINLSKHEEFNWVEWKTIKNSTERIDWFDDSEIVIDYFDINNDSNEEAVFIYKYFRKINYVLNVYYTTKDDGKAIEEYKPYKIKDGWTSKAGEILRLKLTDENNSINNGFGVYIFTKLAQDVLYSKRPHDYSRNIPINYRYIKRTGWGGFSDPEPYPIKLNDTYFIAVFGTIENLSISDSKNRNIVALAKYNPDNTKSDVCILVRANPNTEKYLRYE